VDFPTLNGNLARNAGKGDPYYRFDLSLTRTIPIHERVRIELRADFFNVFNRTNFLGFNGFDALSNFSVPDLCTRDSAGNCTGANPGFSSSCSSCLNPFNGNFIGSGGQTLRISDLQHGRVSSKNAVATGNYTFNGLGDPTVADLARQIQLSLHVRW
jgi:hypothetical protein